MTRISKSRTLDIALMVGSVALLLVGVPLALYLVDTWNESLAPVTTWDRIGYDELYTDTWDGTNITCFAVNESLGWFGDPIVAEQTVVEAVNASDPDSVAVDYASIDAGPALSIYWVLPFTVQDLIDEGALNWRIYLGTTLPEENFQHFSLTAFPYLSEEEVFPGSLDLCHGSAEYWHVNLAEWDVDSEYHYLNFSVLDLIEDRINSGNGRLVAWFTTAIYEGGIPNGEGIDYAFEILETEAGIISQKTVLDISMLAITGILGFVALASTPLWNPTDRQNPGIVGRAGRSVSGWIGRRRSRRRRRRY